MTAPRLNTLSPVGPNDTVEVNGNDGTSRYVGAFQLYINAQAPQYVAPLTGAAVQLNDQTANLIIEPAGTIAALTITTPVNPYDGQRIELGSTQTVSTITWVSGNSGTVGAGIPTTIGAALSTHFGMVYRAANSTWYLV